MFVEGIFCGDVRIFIPNSATISFVRKKKKRQTNINRQTNRQTNKPLSFDRVHKQGGVIIFARGADIV